ncbi:hypothetical protein [Clostridium sp. CCUG 7971]|uniref:hypothetical protein n=1 Tax=Clostridium sp. CCUG 7971 TaxID=2811414 RepID=UPI001ABBB44A|nr:hypothetical protein [Clostridium sp. CCUG 7971]MBO3446434.1 hypothetical protein [Clostridium sp. CCUG 7971]
MDLLKFDDLSLFKSIALDEETLMMHSKCGKYSFYINFKDEIRGVDYYELAIATEDSVGFINKSGNASVIKKVVLDTLANKKGDNLVDDKKKSIPSKVSKSVKSNAKQNNSIYNKKRRNITYSFFFYYI